jgi:hypothetical protein
MNKRILLLITGFCVVTVFSSHTFFSSAAPSGYNGEFGFTCVACHSSFTLNSGGGNVSIAGLPAGTYIPGQSYPITVTISHGASDRTRWGFSLAARNSLGNAVGTFTTSNANVNLIGTAEIGHNAAVFTAPASSYVYTGIQWVAPATPTPDDFNLNFYVVGNAANGNSSSSGDFIYSSIVNLVFTNLPVTLTRFTGSVGKNYTAVLQWETAREQNSAMFVIERSTDGQQYTAIDRVPAAGNSALPSSYQYTDKAPPVTANGRALYRLKQVDLDGKTAYSGVVTVQLKTPATVLEAPTPRVIARGGTAMFRLTAAAPMPLQITVTDAIGKQVHSARQQVTAGTNTISLSSSRFAQSVGVYYVTVQSGSFHQTERIIVQ